MLYLINVSVLWSFDLLFFFMPVDFMWICLRFLFSIVVNWMCLFLRLLCFHFLIMEHVAPEVCFAAICILIFSVHIMFHSLDLHYPRIKLQSYQFHLAGFRKIHACLLYILFGLRFLVNFYTKSVLLEKCCYHYNIVSHLHR